MEEYSTLPSGRTGREDWGGTSPRQALHAEESSPDAEAAAALVATVGRASAATRRGYRGDARATDLGARRGAAAEARRERTGSAETPTSATTAGIVSTVEDFREARACVPAQGEMTSAAREVGLSGKWPSVHRESSRAPTDRA